MLFCGICRKPVAPWGWICYNIRYSMAVYRYRAERGRKQAVNRKLGRLLRPGMGVYFVVLAAFCAAALVLRQYWLAVGESAATLLVFLLFSVNRSRRDRKIRKYLQTVPNTLESIGQGECPFPAVLVRLGDGGIIWTNHRFGEITGLSDTLSDRRLEDVLPDFSTEWLTSGHTQAGSDVTLSGRRYRVYGTTIRAEDGRGTLLGVLYFSDLTELYQVRDEYIRSRPVVSIIMIDNYEELTKT